MQRAALCARWAQSVISATYFASNFFLSWFLLNLCGNILLSSHLTGGPLFAFCSEHLGTLTALFNVSSRGRARDDGTRLPFTMKKPGGGLCVAAEKASAVLGLPSKY